MILLQTFVTNSSSMSSVLQFAFPEEWTDEQIKAWGEQHDLELGSCSLRDDLIVNGKRIITTSVTREVRDGDIPSADIAVHSEGWEYDPMSRSRAIMTAEHPMQQRFDLFLSRTRAEPVDDDVDLVAVQRGGE